MFGTLNIASLSLAVAVILKLGGNLNVLLIFNALISCLATESPPEFPDTITLNKFHGVN